MVYSRLRARIRAACNKDRPAAHPELPVHSFKLQVSSERTARRVRPIISVVPVSEVTGTGI
jgi:hypothetical protein